MTYDDRNAESLLRDSVLGFCKGRNETHGERHASFNAIAEMWTAYLKARKDPLGPISAEDVAWMMVLLKQQRSQWGSKTEDHYADAAGYAAVAWEVSGT